MAGLGIYHYQARFLRSAPEAERRGYSPKLGRFLSADTIVPSYANPQNLNRFSYTVNNPLRYTDPTGHFTCSSDKTSDDYCPGSSTSNGTSPTGNSGAGGGNDDEPDGEPDSPTPTLPTVCSSSLCNPNYPPVTTPDLTSPDPTPPQRKPVGIAPRGFSLEPLPYSRGYRDSSSAVL
jgi:RHS repeat-associated protein